MREDGAVRSQAVLVAIGINWEGRRKVMAVELASREIAPSWKERLVNLRKRSLHGVEFVVSDDHRGPAASDSGSAGGGGVASLLMCTLCAVPAITCRTRPTTIA